MLGIKAFSFNVCCFLPFEFATLANFSSVCRCSVLFQIFLASLSPEASGVVLYPAITMNDQLLTSQSVFVSWDQWNLESLVSLITLGLGYKCHKKRHRFVFQVDGKGTGWCHPKLWRQEMRGTWTDKLSWASSLWWNFLTHNISIHPFHRFPIEIW